MSLECVAFLAAWRADAGLFNLHDLHVVFTFMISGRCGWSQMQAVSSLYIHMFNSMGGVLP